MPRPPPWTLQELDVLRKMVEGKKTRDWSKLLKRFGRTKHSISSKIARMGWATAKRWTPEEDQKLKNGWGILSSRELGKLLPGRSTQGRYERALKLGLHAGAQQGLVSVKALSEDPKWGYAYYATMRILRAGGVQIMNRNHSIPKGKHKGVRYVDAADALEAAKEWEKNRAAVETVSQACARIGMMTRTMWEWLTMEGLTPPRVPGNKGGLGRRFTAKPEVYDMINRKYRVRRLVGEDKEAPRTFLNRREGKETLRVAAQRLHLRADTLREWFALEGLLPPVRSMERVHYYAFPEVFDRVAEKYRTGRNAPKGPRQPPVDGVMPEASSSTKTAGALPATRTPPPA